MTILETLEQNYEGDKAMQKTTIASLRAIRDRLFATEPHGREEERQRAQTEGEPLIMSLAVARQEGFMLPSPEATREAIDQAYENAGDAVKRQRAAYDAQESVNATVLAEVLAQIDATQRADLRSAHLEAAHAEARASDAARELDRHGVSAPASGKVIERWDAAQGALEKTVLVLSRQATLARSLADRKRLALEMDLAKRLRAACADSDRELRAVEERCAARIEQARAERRAHHARRTALGAVLEQVERGELAQLEQ